MYIPRQREVTLKQYGKYVRATEAPRYEPSACINYGGSRKANPNTPKARNNFGTAMHRAFAIALNNDWQWYGHLHIAKEDTTNFDDVYNFIKAFTKRMQKQRERSKSKDLAYLIVPDFDEQDNVQKWFLHIWLMNVPKADTAFFYDIISEKEIIHHWKKHETHYGKSELYKIYSNGYTTNGKWKEQNAWQIFDIMKRTSPFVPKEKNLYYSSNNITVDIVINKGAPSAVNEIPRTSYSNDFVLSKWFTSLDLQENIDEASKYLLWNDPVIDEWDWGENDEPESTQQQEETNDYSYESEYIPPIDDAYFCENAEYYEPVEDFDYSVLNEIYETEVYSYEQQFNEHLFGQTVQNHRPVENFNVIRYC